MSTTTFVDIHCHLLPGIDDGAKDWSESLTMAEIAAADGIRHAVMTPHQLGQYTQTSGDQIRSLTKQFQARLHEAGIPLTVLPGADVRIDSDMIARLERGDCLTLGDARKHVLLELPHELYMPLGPVLSQLQKLGMTGILSHPERNEGILRQPQVLPQLVNNGCLMQITADSLKGTFGEQPYQLSKWMLEHGLVHFISSDAHGTRRRRPTLRKSYEIASKLVGSAYADAICCTNPLAVACGKPIAELPRVRKKGLFQRLFGRNAA